MRKSRRGTVHRQYSSGIDRRRRGRGRRRSSSRRGGQKRRRRMRGRERLRK
jgi:hypothetical protein